MAESIFPERVEKIEARLREAFSPSVLVVEDDSHRHVGHAGAREGGGHFNVTIRAEALDGLSAVARHRAIYRALGEMMAGDIHALSIRDA